ncbi:hypothetical protein AB0I06_30300 [Streptomyces sp. NPDC050674]|uniref:hypothetical protein n=1 Tax=Streptomyces sp. NPDC050674 TaxID=3157216 RepID=UPI0034326578
MGPDEPAPMLAYRPDTRTVRIPGAANDVHLDQSARLHAEIRAYLLDLKFA